MMRISRAAFARAVYFFLATSLPAAPLFAQAIAGSMSGPISGTVLGPDNQPLAGQDVVLHRVSGSSGVTAAEGVSASDGSFSLIVADSAAPADAVYFLAARFEGELYLGDAFRAPFDTAERHVLQVGVAATSARNLISGVGDVGAGGAGAGAGGAGGLARDPTTWLLWVLPAVAVLALMATTLLGRGRIPERRRTLLAIAQLDEAHAAGAAADSAASADSAAYELQRTQLLARLARHARHARVDD
jgi:hypothetical protein